MIKCHIIERFFVFFVLLNMTDSLSPSQLELGPIGRSDGPYFSSEYIYDKCIPCACLSTTVALNKECLSYKTKMLRLVELKRIKAAELKKILFYTDQLKSCGVSIKFDRQYVEETEDMESDLGSREVFHCAKKDCCHRLLFDLKIQYKTAEWGYESLCRQVITTLPRMH